MLQVMRVFVADELPNAFNEHLEAERAHDATEHDDPQRLHSTLADRIQVLILLSNALIRHEQNQTAHQI